jgi:hypothetical protein
MSALRRDVRSSAPPGQPSLMDNGIKAVDHQLDRGLQYPIADMRNPVEPIGLANLLRLSRKAVNAPARVIIVGDLQTQAHRRRPCLM